MRGFVRRHPLASYFALTFLLSWGGILAVIHGGAIPAPPEEANRLFVFVYLAMLVGPSVAGITVTALGGGRDGLSEYCARLMKWRVPARWYLAALLTAPVAIIVALVALAQFPGGFVPNIPAPSDGATPIATTGRVPFLLTGLLVGLGAGFFEELGWTGAALPAMRARFGVMASGALLGLVWGAWHFLAILWGSANAFGSVPIALYLAVALFSFLVPYRVLMAWVYERTQSTFVAIVMHMSLTSSMLILGPAVVGAEVLAFDLVFATVLWGAVGMVLWTTGMRRTETAAVASSG